MHDATAHVLQFFDWKHLPPGLQEISQPFQTLALEMSSKLSGPELTVCLRRLLEAKDAAARAALGGIDA